MTCHSRWPRWGCAPPTTPPAKADHDRINQELRCAYDRNVSEVAARYDPHLGKVTGQPTNADGTAFTQLLSAWGRAWHNAERLTVAAGSAHRRVVITTIEANAHAWAGLARPEAPGHRKLRAEHCRDHRGT